MWILMIVFVCSDDTVMRLLGDCAFMFCFIVDSPPTWTLWLCWHINRRKIIFVSSVLVGFILVRNLSNKFTQIVSLFQFKYYMFWLFQVLTTMWVMLVAQKLGEVLQMHVYSRYRMLLKRPQWHMRKWAKAMIVCNAKQPSRLSNWSSSSLFQRPAS